MNKTRIECPEVARKMIQALTIYDDSRSGREVHLEFADVFDRGRNSLFY